jgi:membrane protease YdiL (CAAX protease family)
MATTVIVSKKEVANEDRRQLIIALAIYLVFTLLFLAANLLNVIGEQNGSHAAMESIAGIIMGLVMFPVFCIGLPLWLARKWNLEFSFWPQRKKWWLGVIVMAIYILLTQQHILEQLTALGISLPDFLIHFVSTTLFHASYYALFATLLFPVIRKNFGVVVGVIATAALWAVYHFAGFYYFPAGVTLRMQVILLASYTVSLLFYLWTENLILVALAHTIGGAAGLATNGTLFNQIDKMLIATAVIMTGFFSYMIIYELRHRDRPYREGWWLKTIIDR